MIFIHICSSLAQERVSHIWTIQLLNHIDQSKVEFPLEVLIFFPPVSATPHHMNSWCSFFLTLQLPVLPWGETLCFCVITVKLVYHISVLGCGLKLWPVSESYCLMFHARLLICRGKWGEWSITILGRCMPCSARVDHWMRSWLSPLPGAVLGSVCGGRQATAVPCAPVLVAFRAFSMSLMVAGLLPLLKAETWNWTAGEKNCLPRLELR